jgi:murein DD-endopeptidase MepM/ murein hydrolase activator NlpD
MLPSLSKDSGVVVGGTLVVTKAKLAGSSRHRPTIGALRLAAIVVSVVFLGAGTLAFGTPSNAYATTYPTWADVVAARANTAATKAAVAQITADIASLNARLQAAQADAAAKGAIAYKAEQSYFAGEMKQKTLQAQVDAAAAKAAKSKQEIAEYAAQLARGDGGNYGMTLNLLLNGKASSQLLNDLGSVGQVSKREDEIYVLAHSQQQSADQLNKLAAAQAIILAAQKKAADAAEAAAAAAATALQDAVAAQTEHQQALTLQLAALTTQQAMTESQYQAGVAAAEAAMGAGRAGVVDAQGWALPTVGRITSPWGYRFDPAAGYAWRMHYGDDIADGCLQPIYAAHGGTVSYAGPYGDIGNYITINDGDGISTAYGHIANGQTFVRIGQQVAAGQNIARTGSTGTSTGCHLYFQVMVNGNPVDPVPFMRDRGITIG